MNRRRVRAEDGVTVLPVLAVVLVVSVIGIGMVGVMNTDITHATVQGAVSRSHFVAQAGIQEAVVQLKANALFRTPAYPSGVPAQAFGGGQFWVWVEDYAEDMVTITSRGRATSAGRTVTSEIRAIAIVGPPIIFGLFGVSTVGAQGANTRTYLAPWQTTGPGVPRGPNMGSFEDINFNDTGTRLNAVSETSPDTVTLRDGTFDDWELYGFTSRPIYNPTDAEPWIMDVMGDIVKAQPETSPWLHSCSPSSYYACMTVQNSSTDITTMYQLRATENMRHVYMDRVRRRILPVATLNPAPLLAAAQANTLNTVVNQAAGIPTPTDSVYTGDDFACLLAYLNNNPGQLAGAIYVRGDVQIGGNARATCGGQQGNRTMVDNLTILPNPVTQDGHLAIEGNLTMEQNTTLTIRHDITNPVPAVAEAARQKVALALFPGSGPTSPGRLTMQGGAQQKLVADGLIYTTDGMEIGPQALVDHIGAMYHNTTNNSRPSFLNNNGTVVLRFDYLATTPLSTGAGAIGVKILSWQQLR